MIIGLSPFHKSRLTWLGSVRFSLQVIDGIKLWLESATMTPMQLLYCIYFSFSEFVFLKSLCSNLVFSVTTATATILIFVLIISSHCTDAVWKPDVRHVSVYKLLLTECLLQNIKCLIWSWKYDIKGCGIFLFLTADT